jgi:predicted DNA-binding protein (UPF0251 family)
MNARTQKIRWGKGSTEATRQLSRFLEPKLGIREVAKIMGVSRGTVFFLEKSALQKIAEEMRAYCAERK